MVDAPGEVCIQKHVIKLWQERLRCVLRLHSSLLDWDETRRHATAPGARRGDRRWRRPCRRAEKWGALLKNVIYGFYAGFAKIFYARMKFSVDLYLCTPKSFPRVSQSRFIMRLTMLRGVFCYDPCSKYTSKLSVEQEKYLTTDFYIFERHSFCFCIRVILRNEIFCPNLSSK